MSDPSSVALDHAVPACPYRRLALFGVRRMAAGGLGDAHAAHAFFTGFGIGFRRPLTLLRAFMAEIARSSSVTLAVAPCCCARMTAAEHELIEALALATDDPGAAHVRLAALLQLPNCPGVAESACAVATSFADLGMPFAA